MKSMGLLKACFTRVRPYSCDYLWGNSGCSENGARQTQVFAKYYIHKEEKPKMAKAIIACFFKASPRTDEIFVQNINLLLDMN